MHLIFCCMYLPFTKMSTSASSVNDNRGLVAKKYFFPEIILRKEFEGMQKQIF